MPKWVVGRPKWVVPKFEPKWVVGRHAGAATGAFGGAPYGATKRVMGVPKWVVGRHAGSAIDAFGGTPYGATKRVRAVPKCGGGGMRRFPLGR